MPTTILFTASQQLWQGSMVWEASLLVNLQKYDV